MVGATILLAGCGGIDRVELEEEIQSRGGGLGADLPLEAIAALEEELGDDLAFRSLTMSVGQVGMQVLVPGTGDQLDNYQYGTSLFGVGGLSDPNPVTGVGPAGELRQSLFRPQRIAFDDFDAIVDEAIEVADLEDGYADGLRVDRTGERPRITVDVANARETVQVQFRGDGTLVQNGDR